MRLWIFSDLHQDLDANAWDPNPCAPVGGWDAVLVAGDVSSPLTDALGWLHDRFAGTRVIYVPGNHDYWSGPGAERFTLDDQAERGRERAARLGIDLLLDDSLVIGGVRIVGATLWTDLRLSMTLTTMDPARVAARGMMDYRRIRRRRSGRHRYVRPLDLVERHVESCAYIDGTLARPHPGPTVVVTHHAPHPGSLSDPYDVLTGCYASDLSDLMSRHRPGLWVHGHLHGRADYRVGTTRVVCNARGHADEASVRSFDAGLVVEV